MHATAIALCSKACYANLQSKTKANVEHTTVTLMVD